MTESWPILRYCLFRETEENHENSVKVAGPQRYSSTTKNSSSRWSAGAMISRRPDLHSY
jgi:hypothetical protein